MDATERRKVGKTDLEVTALGIGTATIGGLHRGVDAIDAKNVVKVGLRRGLTLVDTAPFYGYGWAERQVGDVLRDKPADSYVLSTKVGRLLEKTTVPHPADDLFPAGLPFRVVYDYSYDGIMRSVEDSYHRLGLARIDIALIHDIGEMTHGAGHEAHTNAAMTSGYKALEELKRSGEIRAFGIGVNEVAILEHAMDHGDWDCFLLAGRYTLLETGPLASFLPRCLERGSSIIVGGPYNSGILAGGNTWNYEAAPQEVRDQVMGLQQVADNHGVLLKAAALQFPLAHPAVCSVIPGARLPVEAIENLRLLAQEIPRDFWQELLATGLLPEGTPVP